MCFLNRPICSNKQYTYREKGLIPFQKCEHSRLFGSIPPAAWVKTHATLPACAAISQGPHFASKYIHVISRSSLRLSEQKITSKHRKAIALLNWRLYRLHSDAINICVDDQLEAVCYSYALAARAILPAKDSVLVYLQPSFVRDSAKMNVVLFRAGEVLERGPGRVLFQGADVDLNAPSIMTMGTRFSEPDHLVDFG
jgi:hypothetical protein